jgi:hypothetical protein
VVASKFGTPLIAAALLALAVQVGNNAAQAAQDGMVVIGNSKAPAGDQCTALVAEKVLKQLKLLGLLEWPEACEMARIAAEKTGVTGPVTIEKKP